MLFPRILGVALAASLSLFSVTDAKAFCGFYVGGADAKLFNNATMVAMMRSGKRTVLSMQNNYQGPPANFAMVVPVPVVLQKENVKTLPRAIFDRLDQLAAPRLVEYWEEDPCHPNIQLDTASRSPVPRPAPKRSSSRRRSGVTVEAQFTVGEYEIVILSANDSGGLDGWLKDNGYNIPSGAEPLLRPYVQEGMKFFVAKVDVTKVKMKDGQAMLSPIRFHYEDDKFRLPVRLGLINAKGKQDLIVHILAKERYEAANFKNVTIPTNINVKDEVRQDFGGFYAALFDETMAENPGAVVTEYSWNAGGCDPCPVPPLRGGELATLGLDVIDGPRAEPRPVPSRKGSSRRPRRRPRRAGNGTVLTRLHVRYDKASLAEDLVFKPAPAIAGGREFVVTAGKLEKGSREAPRNNFQGRYSIRHKWKGEVLCDEPSFGRWGGPPNGRKPPPMAARDLAFAPRDQQLPLLVNEPIPEIDVLPGVVKAKRPQAPPTTLPAPTSTDPIAPPLAAPNDGMPAVGATNNRGCACETVGKPQRFGWAAGLLGLVGLGWRRRSKRPIDAE